MGGLPKPVSSLSLSTPRHQYFILVVLASCTALGLVWTQLASLGSSRATRVPINADDILRECAALKLKPTPPIHFATRTASDRFEPSFSEPTLITNATIWTGGKEGTEVIQSGEIYLDKGLIKYVGDRAPDEIRYSRNVKIRRINARLAWVTPAIVDMHSHLGVDARPGLRGSSDTNSLAGITQPWLRSLDGIDTHDLAYQLSISGGVATSLILPGSANAIGGQAFLIKLRPTKERSPLARVLEPPYNLLNGTRVDYSIPPRWRHMKHAAGENPSRVYSGTRMDTIWAFRAAYNEARKIKIAQDQYCEKAEAGTWSGLPSQIPSDLKWEALVDVLRGRVKVNIHIYETVDFTSLVGLSNEFKFPIAAFHHAHEAYLVPDVIKQSFGETPGVAVFATNARYKRESFRGSEFAPKILHESGLRVAMKSDHPVLNSRFLLYEAVQAHYFGLEAAAALSSVTRIPAELVGMGHRIGSLKAGYDADLVIWDSHPLSLGATPQQVYIDGIAQLSRPHVLSNKPSRFQTEPKTPSWNKEAKAAIKYDGLPPLTGKKVSGTIAFVNVRDILMKREDGTIKSQQLTLSAQYGRVLVRDGIVICTGPGDACKVEGLASSEIIDLDGGSIVPGLVSFGSGLGLVEIPPEKSTNDGYIQDPIHDKIPAVIKDIEVHAVDGLAFGGRNTLIAYRSGVTSAVTAPTSAGMFGGLSTSFSLGAAHKLESGAVLSKVAALHVSIQHLGFQPSISTQIAVLRKALSGGLSGERGEWFKKAANGEIPLVIHVNKADHIATLLELKSETDALTSKSIRLVLAGATEAHLLASEIAALGVGVILSPVRSFPYTWDEVRALPGPPLTERSSVGVLLGANVTLGIGIVEEWEARNQRLDIAWTALEANGTLTRAEAIALGSSNIETLLGLESHHDLVVYQGGDVLDLSSKVVAIISPSRSIVEII